MNMLPISVMKSALEKFEAYLDLPIAYRARFLIALLVIPLIASFFQPLWVISMQAPQSLEFPSSHRGMH